MHWPVFCLRVALHVLGNALQEAAYTCALAWTKRLLHYRCLSAVIILVFLRQPVCFCRISSRTS